MNGIVRNDSNETVRDSTPPSGAGDGDSSDTPDSAGAPDAGDGQGQDDPGDDGRDGNGSNADGQDRDEGSDAPASHDPSGTGEIMDAGARGDANAGDGETRVDVIAEEQAWDEAMHQAMNLARAEGKLPGGVEETVKNAHASTLDWRSLLRRYMTDAARRDYNWSLPNRRFIDGGLYLPSIRSEGMETIAVIIDTSGSLPARTGADRVGVLAATTGEARLLELTGIADGTGVLAAGTQVDTPGGTVVADGGPDYVVNAARASPGLDGRLRLRPASAAQPAVMYYPDDTAMIEALAAGRIDAVARGEIGNRAEARARGGAFAVTALDDRAETGGFALAAGDAALAACLDRWIDRLTDDGRIGFREWFDDPSVFMRRARQAAALER